MKKYPFYKTCSIEWEDKIPSHWEIKWLKHQFFFEKGINAQKYTKEYIIENPGKYPVYSGQTENNGVLGHIDTYDYDSNPVILVTTVGARAMSSQIIDGAYSLSQNCAIITPKDNATDIRYYHYLLIHIFPIEKKNISLIMQPSLRFSDLAQYKTLFPPLTEQQAIANFLDHKTAQIDALIDQKQRQIERLQEYRTALINQAVTKGLDPNVPMKDSGIEWLGEIPEHWEISRLKFIGKTLIGLTYKPEEIVNDKYGSLVLRAGNIKNGKIALNDNIYVDKRIPEEIITQKGDILICSRSGSRALIGKNAIIDEIVAGSTFGVFMTLFRSPMNDYLYYIFNSRLFEFQSGLFMTSTINQLTLSVLKNFSVPIPPKYKQKDIVDFLDKKTYNIDKLIDKLNSLIVYYQEYRTALISEAVTGKIDVRDWKGIENGIQTDCP
ncbi:MAG: restriction endonuclease subunit S [Brevefilum sp.]|jgi:type I restriction enzyme S subunit